MFNADGKAQLYDEVPYESGPHPATHPGSLATIATLFGMTPPAIRQCRVLELGCAVGSNLIPMALGLPGGRFIGLDLSPRQVADGQRTIDALGLKNIELRAMDLLEIDGQFGQFDYIICHGVFSWVPRLVQDKILGICAGHLSPNGAAYVSYNTYPGWHSRGMVRGMIFYHIDAAAPPSERVRQAREFLQFLGDNLSQPTSPFAATVKKEIGIWQQMPDDAVLHDLLAEVNEPVYFHQFAARANEHRLQFLAEAELWDGAGALPEDVRQKPACSPDDLVRCEQHLDFLRGRTFRRSLLCHEGVHLNREPPPERIEQFLLAARAIPLASQVGGGVASTASGGQIPPSQIVVGANVPAVAGPGAPGPAASASSVQQFRTDEGLTLSTSKPWVKAALLALFDLWPRRVEYEELCRQARRYLGSAREQELDPLQDPAVLKEPLLRCATTGLVELHLHPSPEAAEINDRPRASPLARLQAKKGRNVTTLRHKGLLLSELERQVLLRLDGRRNHGELLQAVDALFKSGEITLEGEPAAQPVPSTQAMSGMLTKSLRRLAQAGLLEA